MNTSRYRLLLAPLLLLPLACNSKTAPTAQNYTDTLNAYYNDHPDCLFDGSVHFPYETGDPVQTRQMNSLTKSAMLEAKTATIIKVTRYTLTPAGERVAPLFCFGHREVVFIDSSTTPAKGKDGFLETTVHYTYKMGDTPTWAKDADVVAAFPKLAEATSGKAGASITLASTGANWSVPN